MGSTLCTLRLILGIWLWCLQPLLYYSTVSLASLSGNETDLHSILAFKDGITGDPSGALSSWNDSLHYCRWRGVTCGYRHADRIRALNLTSLSLTGYISPSIANLSFLGSIDLSHNNLHGVIPPQLGHLFRLRSLDLRYNVLGGEIPSNLSGCTQLRSINVRYNQLVGQIPMALGTLSQLVTIDLLHNHLSGSIPPSLGNLSSRHFQFLQIDDNALTGGIPSTLGRLSKLKFFGVGINRLSGIVPFSLYNLSNLGTFQLFDNKLSGTLPQDMGTSLPKLWALQIAKNQFQGKVPNSLSNATLLQSITIGRNLLWGTMPDNLGTLKDLVLLQLSANRLEAREPRDWNFLTSLTNCTNLQVLAFAANEFGGALPNSIANFSGALQQLYFGGNRISGIIPKDIGNLRGLIGLAMEENQLGGSIPSTLGMLDLGLFAIGMNQLSGAIPSELGNLTHLSHLSLANNNLSGSIPLSLGRCQQLQKLSLHHNRLSGSIPSELLTVLTLAEIDLSYNLLVGTLPSEIGRLINLQRLNISTNRLSGNIPSTLGDCQSIEKLYLSANSFEGTIPPSLKNLKSIQLLDLSLNNLTGKVPEFLEDLKFLGYLNLSFNNFIGEVPTSGLFANASAISLLGNKMICGGISALNLPMCPSQLEKKRNSSHSLIVIVSVTTGCILLFLCFITYCCWMRKSKVNGSTESSWGTKYKKISYHDLVKATDGFSHDNVIGRGSFGTVYKGVLRGEKIVAVKVLNIERQGASKSFKSECEALRNIRHRNLVKIISVCSSIDFSGHDFKALVFEYFQNGSLEKWLHPEQEVETRTLDFEQRLCIAADVAAALDYLHNHCHSPIVHCDLKPSNVLLDANMIAHVGDFGLARVMLTNLENTQSETSTIGIKGSIGYLAPEYGLGSPISVHGDVYSFGILLLELFTSKRPIDNMFIDGFSLQKFVEVALSEQAMDIIDPHLILLNDESRPLQNFQSSGASSRESVQECFVSLMRIGLNCTKESPRERMAMEAVVNEIHHIQEDYIRVTRSMAS